MTLRAGIVSLFATCLLCIPAAASQPEGLAGKVITNAEATNPGDPLCRLSFEWYEFFGSNQLDPADTVTLEMAIIPFRSGTTSVGLDEGVNATTFVSIAFLDGLVNGLPYNRSGWNDITVQVRPFTQDYVMTVNGRRAGPFPFGSSCTGGCFSMQAFRLNGSDNDGGSIAWIDAISIVRQSAVEYQPIFEFSADPCLESPHVTGGGLVFAQPPQRVRSRR